MNTPEAAQRLYGAPLAEFIACRTALAAETRASGLPGASDAARQIQKFKKPTVAAWVINQLVRAQTAQIEQLLRVGAALRDATRNLDGEQLRALATQRRQLTVALINLARQVAADRQVAVSTAVADQVGATLTAAMVNPSAAMALRTGLLVTSLSATGPESLDLREYVALSESLEAPPADLLTAGWAIPGPPSSAAPPDAVEERARMIEKCRAAVASAERRLHKVRGDHRSAIEEHERAQARILQANAHLDELRRLVVEAEVDADRAASAWSSAEVALQGQVAALERLTQDLSQARAELAAAEGEPE